MRYENAGALLPPDLLKQVQRYASGTLLYVPAAEAEKLRREPTGYQRWIRKRNKIVADTEGGIAVWLPTGKEQALRTVWRAFLHLLHAIFVKEH